MLTKTTIALSTLLVIGFASAALASDASDVPGNYSSFVGQTVQQPAGAAAYAEARQPVKPFTATEKRVFNQASVAAISR
jgi:hypothetical protein